MSESINASQKEVLQTSESIDPHENIQNMLSFLLEVESENENLHSLRQVTDNFSDHPEALQIIHSGIEKLYSQVQEIQKKGKNKAKTTIKNMTARLENMEIKNDNPNKLLEQLV